MTQTWHVALLQNKLFKKFCALIFRHNLSKHAYLAMSVPKIKLVSAGKWLTDVLTLRQNQQI